MKTSPKSIFDKRYKKLVSELVSIRKEKNISQRELANMANVSHCYIGRTEICERRLDLIEFIDLCKVLGLSKKEMLDLIQKIL
ncbi:MAG: helix-turn-helix transcriptional regulator [Alphaproteobacteria bacterium]|nr:helix-turn-helix transcriptional regulator [Alphaproteobacteria bacterium]